MAFETAITADPRRAKKGPSIKMSVVKLSSGPSKIMFTMNELARALYFPDCKVGDPMNVQFGTGEDKGKVLIASAPMGKTPLAKYTKGSLSISVVAWRGFTAASHKSKECGILTFAENSVALKIPHPT
jgi:hypothetical protein